ncbi:hypothetical protein FS935_01905 [Metabacillus litoralis]|uniref:Uncharacterized protein n=1 Tax=Metabacillus litoralis TaxID=152268 RepID=A0A5C6WAX2_9BACI|nr:hypothetical protein [Metabacillus litoralis]TXC92972.1 hypothetical protein FS935_01905 [Metabacillus litoralis]
MNFFYRLLFFSMLSVLAILLISKATELWLVATNVNGNGIGIDFFGLKINDSVQAKEIPKYAIGFFIASFLAIGGGFFIISRSALKTKNKTVN